MGFKTRWPPRQKTREEGTLLPFHGSICGCPAEGAFPWGTTGSLCSSFLPDRVVSLPVKRPYAITLCDRLPIGLRAPLEASVTLLEATTPVKLPTIQCPPA